MYFSWCGIDKLGVCVCVFDVITRSVLKWCLCVVRARRTMSFPESPGKRFKRMNRFHFRFSVRVCVRPSSGEIKTACTWAMRNASDEITFKRLGLSLNGFGGVKCSERLFQLTYV